MPPVLFELRQATFLQMFGSPIQLGIFCDKLFVATPVPFPNSVGPIFDLVFNQPPAAAVKDLGHPIATKADAPERPSKPFG